MPGQVSLSQVQYYAHPRNSFWPIMQNYFSFNPSNSYQQNVVQLNTSGLGLWDVIAHCQRQGSLDSSIVAASIQTNAFTQLFSQYSQIQHVFLNGQKAAQLFEKKVLKQLQPEINLSIYKLPSTSPANATMTFAEKQQAWHQALSDANF
ncbi:T/U mismatch-specific DNA glycosylase [Catenovulum agarivorans DS-2]|uniref:T/U mismatch-specific DNA glycosylase n=2 Tax=Catenovulum agarivorans TaxID=1172192 RepID=W7QV78_9ALTE|nr:T/U mismatch-specific DNA glycosylase [Catenovulum agarivorans DS-2]